jgi:O-methyltransferase
MEKSYYIELLKLTLTDYHRMEFGEYKPIDSNTDKGSWKFRVLRLMDKFLNKKGFKILRIIKSKQESRYEGKDWPAFADTMVGIKRLDNIEYCFREIFKDNIPGDLIETGVWRGGSTILMRALLKENNIENRTVWVADSFEGLPKPNENKYSADKGDKLYTKKELGISLETVKNNFKKYNLLDDKVQFLKGWFKDTLPVAPIDKLAILRLDGDMYESTMDGLTNLYPKLSIGGFIIIDDWGAITGCKKAVLDYRKQHKINEEILEIDWTGVYWKKEK